MTKTISWGDGSGDNILISYSATSGDQSLQISSDPNNTSSARTKSVTIATIATKPGEPPIVKTISITQQKVEEKTITLYPSSFDTGTYQSISGQTTPVGKGSSNTTYATINLKTGSRAATDAYWKFDCSSIPQNATITSVTCTAKCYISNTQSSRISARTVQLYSGSTAKGSSSTVSNSTTAITLSCGNWTRSELNNIRIGLKATRGTSSTTTTYYFRFYGATLTIKYK